MALLFRVLYIGAYYIERYYTGLHIRLYYIGTYYIGPYLYVALFLVVEQLDSADPGSWELSLLRGSLLGGPY